MNYLEILNSFDKDSLATMGGHRDWYHSYQKKLKGKAASVDTSFAVECYWYLSIDWNSIDDAIEDWIPLAVRFASVARNYDCDIRRNYWDAYLSLEWNKIEGYLHCMTHFSIHQMSYHEIFKSLQLISDQILGFGSAGSTATITRKEPAGPNKSDLNHYSKLSLLLWHSSDCLFYLMAYRNYLSLSLSIDLDWQAGCHLHHLRSHQYQGCCLFWTSC
jgi:hypothetical protein